MKDTWFFGTQVYKLKFLASLILFCSIVIGFLSPIKVTAQETRTDAQLIYLRAYIKCANELGPKLADPAYATYPEVKNCKNNKERSESNNTTAVTPESTAANNQALANGKAANDEAKAAEAKAAECSLLTNLSACIDEGFAWIIKHTLLTIAGWFLWLTATAMNYAINIGILEFSTWAPDALYPIWIIIRQIVSLFVVFAGLFLGFMYIINKGDDFKKYIPWVVIFALFVNFSYPITRALIDVSNVISLNIYTSAVGSDALTGSTSNLITGEKTPGALIRSKLGLQGLVDYATSKPGKEGLLNQINSTPAALLAVIFIAYAAYIFYKVTLLLVARTAVLVFLIIASPILLVDTVIPKLGPAAAKLREMFFQQLFVGPIFTIMLAITLKFLDVFQTNGALGGGSLSSVTATTGTGASAIVMFFNLLMMLVMLKIMITVTESTSGSVGRAISGAVGTVGGFALGAATGGAGLIGRATIGRAAAKLGGSKWMQNKQGGFVGRQLANMTDSVAKSSFDGRNSSIVQAGTKRLGLNMGMGSKMNYEMMQENRAKNLKAHLERVGTYQQDYEEKLINKETGKAIIDEKTGKQATILHRKGDADNRESSIEARKRIIENSGGVKFLSSDANKAGLKADLEKANQQLSRSQDDKIIKEYKEIGDDEEKRKAYKEKYASDANIKRKLESTDVSMAADKYNSFDMHTESGRQGKKEFMERSTKEGADANIRQKITNLESEYTIKKYKEAGGEATTVGRELLEDKENKLLPEVKKALENYNATQKELLKNKKTENAELAQVIKDAINPQTQNGYSQGGYKDTTINVTPQINSFSTNGIPKPTNTTIYPPTSKNESSTTNTASASATNSKPVGTKSAEAVWDLEDAFA